MACTKPCVLSTVVTTSNVYVNVRLSVVVAVGCSLTKTVDAVTKVTAGVTCNMLCCVSE